MIKMIKTLCLFFVAFLFVQCTQKIGRTDDISECYIKKGTWFETMMATKEKVASNFIYPVYEDEEEFNSILNPVWLNLENDFPDKKDFVEMTWERKDDIWNDSLFAPDYSNVCERYIEAYNFSCKNSGISPKKFEYNLYSKEVLLEIRLAYLKAKEREYEILTPPASDTPNITGPKIFGVRPGNPFIFTVTATGKRPMYFSAQNLPAGLEIDSISGRIQGKLLEKGEYYVSLLAKNSLGISEGQFKIVVGEDIALTPPMGWNNWNCFGCSITENDIRDVVDVMVKTGLKNYGWTYINIDDCWMNRLDENHDYIKNWNQFKDTSQIAMFYEEESIEKYKEVTSKTPRDSTGRIIPNKNFPDMKGLSDYVHENGLKIGIYSAPGPITCQGFIGSYQHEEIDAIQYAEWGIDYLKYDWCGLNVETNIEEDTTLNLEDNWEEITEPFFAMRRALDKVDRDIFYSVCQYGLLDVWKWGEQVGGNAWRTTDDIYDAWECIADIAFDQEGKEKYAKPGHWNDVDMLVLGYVGWSANLYPTKLTANEQYSHVSLWSLLSSPLLIGCDLTRLDDFTLNLLTNNEVIAINQDPLGEQARRVHESDNVHIWMKNLEDGSKAVGIFNMNDGKTNFDLNWKDIGLKGKYNLRDLWRQKDLLDHEDSYNTDVLRHGVVLLKMTKVN